MGNRHLPELESRLLPAYSLLMYVGVLPAGLSAVHIRSACRGQERVYPCLGLELTDGCEPLVGGWDSNPDREVPVRTGLIEICRGTEEAHDCLRAMARLACGVGGSRREGEPGPNEVTCWAGQGESTGRREGRFALARSWGMGRRPQPPAVPPCSVCSTDCCFPLSLLSEGVS